MMQCVLEQCGFVFLARRGSAEPRSSELAVLNAGNSYSLFLGSVVVHVMYDHGYEGGYFAFFALSGLQSPSSLFLLF